MPLYNPITGTGGGAINNVFINATATVSTASLTFVDAISTSITITTGTNLQIVCTGALSNTSNNQTASLRLTLDGTAISNSGFGTRFASGAGNQQAIAIVIQVPITAGAHTVAVQWLTTGGTLQARPTTNNEHLSLSLTEVA
jgi:hypothetical protein